MPKSPLNISKSFLTLTSDFTVTITEGSLIGNQYYGSLSFNDSIITGVGEELITPANGNIMVNFTFIDRNLIPKTYTQLDDIFAPEFPRIDYENGDFAGLVYYLNFDRPQALPLVFWMMFSITL
jgi:hypothetical protein